MGLDLISFRLELALKQPGCPICRRRSDAERAYIRSLLEEHTNDPVTRKYIVDSLGYCPEHSWQTGRMEVEEFGSPLGTARIYQQLAGVVAARLARYANRLHSSRQSAWKRRLQSLLGGWLHLPVPVEIQPRAQCRVCQKGDEAVRTSLEALLDGLCNAQSSLCELYDASDGLCLPHLRQALTTATQADQSAAKYLIENTLHRLDVLQREIDEFARMERWDYHTEAKPEREKDAWLNVLTFFAGSPKSNIEPKKDAK
jgi:FtsZ-binding cell division protein ZapB